MSKIAILGDTHAGVRNASDVFADNAEKFYSETFFPYLLENDIKQIIHMGDYYDNRKVIALKAINRNRKMFLEPLRENNIHMDIILGNHDVAYKNTNELNSLKELLGHYMDVVTIHMKPSIQDFGGFKVGLLPWINLENYDESIDFIKNCKTDTLFGHLDLAGFDLMKGVVNQHGMDRKLFSRFENVYTGHFHTKSQQDNITYLGSQMEFFWSDANDPKHFHILDTSTRDITPIRNPHTLFHKIYYNEETTLKEDVPDVNNKFVKIIVEDRKDLFTFDKYVDKIQSQKIHDLKILESYEEFTGASVQDEDVSIEDTGTLLDTYVDAVETDLNKKILKTKLRSLLTEAETFDIM